MPLLRAADPKYEDEQIASLDSPLRRWRPYFILMMIFWMPLGGAAGIKLTQSIWRILGLGAGEASIAVPVGSVVGALVRALLGSLLLVLLKAVFAGSTCVVVRGRREGP